jgi:hypothetical protein
MKESDQPEQDNPDKLHRKYEKPISLARCRSSMLSRRLLRQSRVTASQRASQPIRSSNTLSDKARQRNRPVFTMTKKNIASIIILSWVCQV